MKKFVLTLLFAILVFLTSCSIEPVEELSFEFFEGTYHLTEYSFDVPADLNNDTNYSSNLLEEIDCENNETLVFDKQGLVYSNFTFNPLIEVALVNTSLSEFDVDVICDTEGLIGTASSYSKSGNIIKIDDRIATISGNNITMIFKKALNVYNQDKSLVIGTKDLKLVYTKM